MDLAAANITALLVYSVIVTVTPGPTNIVILSGVYNFGMQKTLRYVYGATAAIGTLLAGSVILSSLLMAVIPKIILVMQAIGSIYMLYLAYQICGISGGSSTAGQAITFTGGFWMQLVNPKVVVFTMTVIPSFVMPFETSPAGLAIAALAVTAIAFAAMLTWVLFGTVFKEFLQKYQKAVNLFMGIFLVYSAIMISGVADILKR